MTTLSWLWDDNTPHPPYACFCQHCFYPSHHPLPTIDPQCKLTTMAKGKNILPFLPLCPSYPSLPLLVSFLCVCFAIQCRQWSLNGFLCFSLGCFLFLLHVCLCLFVCNSCLVCPPPSPICASIHCTKRKKQQNALQNALKDILRWHAEQTCYTRPSGFYENSAAFLLSTM